MTSNETPELSSYICAQCKKPIPGKKGPIPAIGSTGFAQEPPHCNNTDCETGKWWLEFEETSR